MSEQYMTVHYKLRRDDAGNVTTTGEKFAQFWSHVPYKAKYEDETARFKIELALDELKDEPVVKVTRIL